MKQNLNWPKHCTRPWIFCLLAATGFVVFNATLLHMLESDAQKWGGGLSTLTQLGGHKMRLLPAGTDKSAAVVGAHRSTLQANNTTAEHIMPKEQFDASVDPKVPIVSPRGTSASPTYDFKSFEPQQQSSQVLSSKFFSGVSGIFAANQQEGATYLSSMDSFFTLKQFVGMENVCVASQLNPRWKVKQHDSKLNKYSFQRTSMLIMMQMHSDEAMHQGKVFVGATALFQQFSIKNVRGKKSAASSKFFEQVLQADIQLIKRHKEDVPATWLETVSANQVPVHLGRCAAAPRAVAHPKHPAHQAIQAALQRILDNAREPASAARLIALALLLAEPGRDEHADGMLRGHALEDDVMPLLQALRYRASAAERGGAVYADVSFNGIGACFLPAFAPLLPFNTLWAMLHALVLPSTPPAAPPAAGHKLRGRTQVDVDVHPSLCSNWKEAQPMVSSAMDHYGDWHFLAGRGHSFACTEYGMILDYWGNAQRLQTAHELRNLAVAAWWEYDAPDPVPGREKLPPLSMLLHHGANMNAIHNNPGMPARYASQLTRGLLRVHDNFVEASLHRPHTTKNAAKGSITVACYNKAIMRYQNPWDMPLPAASGLAVVGLGVLALNASHTQHDPTYTAAELDVARQLTLALTSVEQAGDLVQQFGLPYRRRLHALLMKQAEIARHAGERNGPYTTNVSCTPRVVVLQRGEGSNLRAFSNLPAVLAALHKWLGYTPPVKYIKGSMSLYEQAAAVAGAELIITPHGSHNMGTMFGGKTGVAMLEVMPHPRDTAAHGYSAVHGGAQYFSVGHTPTELATPVSGALPGRSGRPWSNAVHMRAASREWHEACRVPAMQAYWGAQEDIRGVSFPLWRFCQHRTKVRFITESDTTVDTGVLLRDARKVMAWMTGGRCT